METLLKLPAASVDRFSIIRLPDGRIGAWERKTMTCIIDWGKFGVKIKGATIVEVLKAPAHLAADFINNMQCNPGSTQYEMNSAINVCNGRIEGGAEIQEAFGWLNEETEQIFNGEKLYTIE